jgi:hypothetical protein
MRRIVNKTGADRLVHPEFGELEAGPDGVFEVEHGVAEELLKNKAHWAEEAPNSVLPSVAEHQELRNPRKIPGAISDLRRRLAKVEAVLEAHGLLGELVDDDVEEETGATVAPEDAEGGPDGESAGDGDGQEQESAKPARTSGRGGRRGAKAADEG